MVRKAKIQTGAGPVSAAGAPLISVITVVLNGRQYLKHAMESVISQTYRHLEYLVLDGGSTDGSVDLIKEYSHALAYWHSRPDRGVAHAYNLGLEKAKGDWILFLSADDYFLDSQVMAQMAPYLITHREAEVVFGQTVIMTRGEDPRPVPLARIYGRPWRWQDFRWYSPIPHPSAFTSRSYFDRWGRFDESFQYTMDYELYLRADKRLRTQFVPIPISGMRRGGVSGKSLVRTYAESRRAQLKNQAQPGWLCWLNFFWQVWRCYLGRVAHWALDPLAPKILWPGRYSGRALKP